MPKSPILPELPALSQAQKATLIKVCSTYPHEDRILHYLETGELRFSDMPGLSPDRKSRLEKRYKEWLDQPDPDEIASWESIVGYGTDFMTMNPDVLDDLEKKIKEYIQLYPTSIHINEAQGRLIKIRGEKEKNEWSKVDPFSYPDIIDYLRNHRDTVFFADAEQCLWDILEAQAFDIGMVKTYLDDMKVLCSNDALLGKTVKSHVEKAEGIVGEYDEWNSIKNSRDIKEIIGFAKRYPESVFIREIRNTINNMKPAVMEDFRKNLSKSEYVDFFYELTKSGFFTENDFINAGIVTDSSLEKLHPGFSLPPIDQTKIIKSSPENHTDVFMFGIPSTGKTCILMGLLGSPYFDWNAQLYGGDYAIQLSEYLDAGKTPDATGSEFVSLVSGRIIDSNDETVSHPISLIDMGGEAFAEKIASNHDGKVSFEDMGIGATNLLSNDNDKVFFIIVDPTTEIVELPKREAEKIVYKPVNQKYTIKKLIDLLTLPENKKIMERVKAIHFIATKSDMLDVYGDRDTIAKERVRQKYVQSLETLKNVCRKDNYAINVLSSYLPRLYTFSLGRFYLGGVYDYDSSDSDKIIQLISYITAGQKGKSFLGKIQDALNTKVI